MDCTPAVSKDQAIIWAGNYNAARHAFPATLPILAQLAFFTGRMMMRPESSIPRTEEMKMTVAPTRPGLPGKPFLPESLQIVNPSTASASPPPSSTLAEGASNRASSIPPAKRPVRTEARRCAERGCIYPAGPGESGRCLQHQRQHREPALFHSRQPSTILLDCAKFGLPEEEPEDSRFRDRRRLAAQREAFLGGAA